MDVSTEQIKKRLRRLEAMTPVSTSQAQMLRSDIHNQKRLLAGLSKKPRRKKQVDLPVDLPTATIEKKLDWNKIKAAAAKCYH